MKRPSGLPSNPFSINILASHLVGYTSKDGKDWYLIKDSGAGARNNTHAGYYFYNADFVKLKMLGIMVNKSAIPDVVTKMRM